MAEEDESQSQYIVALADEINPPDGYQLPAKFGNIGPGLVTAGVIDYDAFVSLYESKAFGNSMVNPNTEYLH